MISSLLRQRLKAEDESEKEIVQNKIRTLMKGARHGFAGAEVLWPQVCDIALEYHFKEQERPNKHEIVQIFHLDAAILKSFTI